MPATEPDRDEEEIAMNDEAGRETRTGLPGEEREVRTRRPYVPPSVRTGPAFERVSLTSGCNFTADDECPIPC